METAHWELQKNKVGEGERTKWHDKVEIEDMVLVT